MWVPNCTLQKRALTKWKNPLTRPLQCWVSVPQDPITCLSVVGIVEQLVDFATKLISEGRGLYEAGELSIHEKAALATNDLLDLTTRWHESGGVKMLVKGPELARGSLCCLQ